MARGSLVVGADAAGCNGPKFLLGFGFFVGWLGRRVNPTLSM